MYVQRGGRPKHEWAAKVGEHARADAEMNPPRILEELVLDKVDYERRVEIDIACAYRAVTKSH